jgi:hypothetical protein
VVVRSGAPRAQTSRLLSVPACMRHASVRAWRAESLSAAPRIVRMSSSVTSVDAWVIKSGSCEESAAVAVT